MHTLCQNGEIVENAALRPKMRVKISTRQSWQFWGQMLKTKELAFWWGACTRGDVQKIPPPRQIHSWVNSRIQDVTAVVVRVSTSVSYQATADSNGNHRGVYQTGNPGRGCLASLEVNYKYPVLPYTHSGCECCQDPGLSILGLVRGLGLLLSGNCLTRILLGILTPMEGV